VPKFHFGIGAAGSSPPKETWIPFEFVKMLVDGRIVRIFRIELEPIIISIWPPQRKLAISPLSEKDKNFYIVFAGFLDREENGRPTRGVPIYFRIYY